MQEYGLFNDEGLVEGGFWSRDEAFDAMTSEYDPDDGLEVHEVCPDHPEQPKLCCWRCEAEGGEETNDETES